MIRMNRWLFLFIVVVFALMSQKQFTNAEPTPKDQVRSLLEIVSIIGRIGEGRIYCNSPLKLPGEIVDIELVNIEQNSDEACLWGSEIIPGSDKQQCRVWVEFCGALGKRAIGVFNVKVSYRPI